MNDSLELMRKELLLLKTKDGEYVISSLIAADPSRLHTLLDYITAHTDKAVRNAKLEEARRIFFILWQDDGAPFKCDDPPRAMLEHLEQLENGK